MTTPDVVRDSACPKCERGGTGPHPSYCTPFQRFWRKVQIVGPCWEFHGANNGRYGQMRLGKHEIVNVHRWIFEQMWGPIADGKVVMHSCDNPKCVRPAHLSLGTQKDNINDAVRKGRHRGGRAA